MKNRGWQELGNELIVGLAGISFLREDEKPLLQLSAIALAIH
jgi:hypothetical protein